MTNEEFVKKLFLNAQNNYVFYKNELEATFKDRTNFPPTDPTAMWYKEHLKEMRNLSKALMGDLEEELEFERAGLNPPYCYTNGKGRTE